MLVITRGWRLQVWAPLKLDRPCQPVIDSDGGSVDYGEIENGMKYMFLRWMEEILHHLGWLNPYR